VIIAFCFLPIVPLALRVASLLAMAAACCSVVSGVFFGAANPKSASLGLVGPNAAIARLRSSRTTTVTWVSIAS